MQKLAELCVRRPVFASVLILVMVVVGFVGFTRLGVDRFPEVELPTVTVSTTYPGSSPEAIETEITDKIEEQVNTISGIDELKSTSSEGTSNVTITFVLEKDADVAAQEVRDKVQLAQRELPEGTDPPIVQRFDSSALPILSIAVSGKRSIRDLTEYADKTLRRQLESAGGVGQVDIRGGRLRQVNVFLDPSQMKSADISINQVLSALQTQNVEIPGGDVEQADRTLTLRTRGRVQNVQDFANLVIRSGGGGAVLLGDIARIQNGAAVPTSYAELNGVPTVQLSILKQSGTNTLAVIDGVKKRLEAVQATKPGGVDIRVVRDQSDYIEAAVHTVEEHLILGSLLASLVVLLFLLNWRSTIISAIAIPTSIISTFALMSAMGFTLNLITLLALTLAVGIVIDDAIVVLENIYRFIEEKGMPPYQAAIEATQEIGLAVLATTLSLIAVFAPVAFMSGIVGRFMRSFGLTMSFAIAVSLIVSFTLTPMLSARWLRGIEKGHGESKNGKGGKGFVARMGRFYGHIDAIYEKMLRWSMGHRWAIVLLCFAALATIPFVGKQVPFNFLPNDDESQFQVSLELPLGSSLAATTNVAKKVVKDLRDNVPEIDYCLVTAGQGGGSAGYNEASVYVKLKDVSKRVRDQDTIITGLRKSLEPKLDSQGVLSSFSAINSFGGLGGRRGAAQIQYVVSGPELKVLQKATQAALAQYKQFPGVVDADTNYVAGSPEIAVEVNRPLAGQLGVSPSDVATALRYLVGGDKITDFNQGGEQYDVNVRSTASFREDETGIGQIPIAANITNEATTSGNNNNANQGITYNTVPISSVVTFQRSSGPSTINRQNRKRQITLLANVLPGASQAAVAQAMKKAIDDQHLPPDYTAEATGTSKEQARTGAAFGSALLLSLVFMYLILAAQFESWLHPVTILLSLPLTIPFALISLLLFGQTLNIFSMLGILVLFGVVKKNAILQIDHTNQLRERGMNRYDAIIQANRDRLRPILMTTLAFVAGMLPLVVSRGTGAGTNRAIGSVIFGGQSLSLLLTLLATPVVYSLFDDLSNWLSTRRAAVQQLFGGKPSGSTPPPSSPRVEPVRMQRHDS